MKTTFLDEIIEVIANQIIKWMLKLQWNLPKADIL